MLNDYLFLHLCIALLFILPVSLAGNVLFQILEQHIKTVLPGLKAELNSHLLIVVKELRTYGEAMESKVRHQLELWN